MIGPNFERKNDKPPILRNMGGFYSEDDFNNPSNCEKWYAFKEDDKKKKGYWTDTQPRFHLSKVCKLIGLLSIH